MVGSSAVLGSVPKLPLSAGKKDAPGDWSRALREAGPYLGMGSVMAVTLLLSLGAGYWADGVFGTRPFLFLAGGVLGIAAALYYFLRLVGGKQ
jgi:hypothetical protein